jgi:hypothetical protein
MPQVVPCSICVLHTLDICHSSYTVTYVYYVPLTYATDPNIAPASGLWNGGGELFDAVIATLLPLLVRDTFFLLELVRLLDRFLKLF